nr:MAG TPA: hypothetical protein [Caudoviricetes sp.]
MVLPDTTLPFYTISVCVQSSPGWAPRRGHGDKHHIIDHVLCVVLSDSTTSPVDVPYLLWRHEPLSVSG